MPYPFSWRHASPLIAGLFGLATLAGCPTKVETKTDAGTSDAGVEMDSGTAPSDGGETGLQDAGGMPQKDAGPSELPSAPPSVTAAGYGSGAASVLWATPANFGNPPFTGFIVTASPGNLSSPMLPVDQATLIFTGLTNGTTYTFSVAAVNSLLGNGPATMSSPVLIGTTPDAPTSATATITLTSASVSWTAPANTGGAPIVTYLVTSIPTVGGSDAGTDAGPVDAGPITYPPGTVTLVVDAGVTSISTCGQCTSSQTCVTDGLNPFGACVTSTTASMCASADGGAGCGADNFCALKPLTEADGGTLTEAACFSVLSPGTDLSTLATYTFFVQATNSFGTGAATPTFAPVTEPCPPGNVVATAGNGLVSLSWNAQCTGGSPISGYVLDAYSAGGGTMDGGTTHVGTPVTVGPQTLNYNFISGLTNGTTYWFTVTAANAVAGNSAAAQSNMVVPTGPPGAPTSVSAVAGNQSAAVSFTPPVDDGGTTILGFSCISSPGGFSAGAGTGSGSVVISGLTNGTTYTFACTATNLSGAGPASAASNAVTPGVVPGAPTSVHGFAQYQSVSLSWIAPMINGGNPITGYLVTTEPGGVVTTETTTLTNALIGGLTNGRQYTFTVQAVNAMGPGPASTASAVVIPGGPPPGTTEAITLSTSTLDADGRSNSTVTVTLLDSASNPVTGVEVNLNATGTGNLVWPASGTTDGGVFNAKISSTQVGTKTVTATAGTLVQTKSIQFESVDCSGTYSLAAAAASPSLTALPDGGNAPVGIAAVDFGNTSILDLAVTDTVMPLDPNYVSVLRGAGNGTFESPIDNSEGSGTQFFAVGDFDNDGDLDVAISNAHEKDIVVAFGNGDGTFSAAISVFTGYLNEAIAAADFNNDGILDLVVGNPSNNNVTVLLGNGTRALSFGTPITLPCGNDPSALWTGDFNEDGKADFVVANAGDNALVVFLGNNNGAFTKQTPLQLGTAATMPMAITGGYFSSVRHIDLAVANAGTGNVSVLIGIGDGTFKVPVNYAADTGSSSIVTGDFNGDGILDLAVSNFTAGDVTVLGGNGDGTFTVPMSSIPVASSSGSIALGDFNGDSMLDLAVINPAGPSVMLLMGTCGP